MLVAAFNTPKDLAWRWRIVNYAGEMVEESSAGFATIALAVAEGTKRLHEHADRDLSVPPRRTFSSRPRR